MKNIKNLENIYIKDILSTNEKLLLNDKYFLLKNICFTKTNKKIFFKDYQIDSFRGAISKENIAFNINKIANNLTTKLIKYYNLDYNNVASLTEVTYKGKLICYQLVSYYNFINVYEKNIFAILKVIYGIVNHIPIELPLNNCVIQINKLAVLKHLAVGTTRTCGNYKVFKQAPHNDKKYNIFVYKNGKHVAMARASSCYLYAIKYL